MSSASSTSGALVVEGLSKRFGSLVALAGVSLSVSRAQILGLIGPNGAGKTTLLECLSGLQPIDAGRVLWNGTVLPPSQRRTAMFYLPDAITPYPQQTTRQVLDFYRGVYNIERSRAQQLITVLGLGALLDRAVERLSKGGRRRLLLAISLLAPHPVLLIDEPFDGLDLRQTLEMMELLREERDQGRALVLSIHQLSEAQRVCDCFVLLTDGRVAGRGTLAELRERAQSEAGSLEEVFLALS